jgi:hypothetical protein
LVGLRPTPRFATARASPYFPALTARVTPVAPGSGIPIGVVDFLRGNQLLGTVSLSDGIATFQIGPLSNGKIRFIARYRGTANHVASTSPELTQTVQKK